MVKVLRVGVDASPLAYSFRTGIGRYLECILPHVVEAAGEEARFTLFSGRPLVNPKALELVESGTIRTVAAHCPSLYAWQQTGMAWHYLTRRQHVYFSPDGMFPPLTPGKAVGMYHDVLWAEHPETLAWHIRTVFRLRHGAGLRRADRALTGTQSSKREMRRVFGKKAEKLEVLPCYGVDMAHFRPPREDELHLEDDFRARHDLREPFLLTAGNLQPHKNLAVVPKALEILRQGGRDIPLLAVAGFGDRQALLNHLPEGFPEDKVRCLGYLSESDLCQAYRLALAYVFPSLYEGFGFPVVEAQSSGAPVLYANATSLPEVAGDAGLPFNPHSPKDLAAAIARVLDTPDLRRSMIAKGFVHSAKFRWDRAGETLWRVLRQAAGRE
ncbi:glycosyltransferase family 4 protein [Fundidesulfovibrio butyratiphilus]